MATYSRKFFYNIDNERPNTFIETRNGGLVTHDDAFGANYQNGPILNSSALNYQEDGVFKLHDKIDKGGTAIVHEELQNKTLQEQIDYINGKIYKFTYTIPYNGAQKVILPKTMKTDGVIRVIYSGNAAVSITQINDIALAEGEYYGYNTDSSGTNTPIAGVFDGTNGAAVGPIQVIADHPDSGTTFSHAETTIHKSQYTGLVYTSYSNHMKSGSFSETIRGKTALEPVFAEGINSMLINVHSLQSGISSRPQYVTVEITYF